MHDLGRFHPVATQIVLTPHLRYRSSSQEVNAASIEAGRRGLGLAGTAPRSAENLQARFTTQWGQVGYIYAWQELCSL